ncbi:MAG: hypothetical protein ACQEUY_16605 [Pseudomonadota bacterium]
MKYVIIWLLRLGKVFVRRAPAYTILSIIFTLLSQLTILISLFLPLKVIILLGSEGVPRYFPQVLLSVERDYLVLGLSLIAVFSYVLHLLCEKMLVYFVNRGSSTVLDKSEKIVIFERQQELAVKSYQRYANSLSVFIFVTIALLGFYIVYPLLFACVLSLFLLVALCIRLASNFFSKAKISNSLVLNSKKISGVGFLSVFAIIIVDFLYFTPPGIIYVIICMVLSRQVFNKLGGLVTDIAYLYQQKSKINALFFRKHIFQGEVGRRESSVWKFMGTPQWKTQIFELCNSIIGIPSFETAEIEWVQNSTPGIVGFLIKIRHKCQGDKVLYFKLYDNKKNAWAIHEASLLMQENASDLPSPDFLGGFMIAGLHCHVFDITEFESVFVRNISSAYFDISASLLSFSLDAAFIDSYKRSRPFLWDRIDVTLIERLRIVASISNNELDSKYVELFSKKRKSIAALLKKLPLAIINPDVSNGHVWKVCGNGELAATNWSRWALEPMGTSWPVHSAGLEKLKIAFDNNIKINQPHNSGINYEMVKLAALIGELDKHSTRQHYEQAIALIPDIILAYEEAQ